MLTFDNIELCEDIIKIYWCTSKLKRKLKRILRNACDENNSNKIIKLVKKYKTDLPINKNIVSKFIYSNFEMFELLIITFGKSLPIDKSIINYNCRNNKQITLKMVKVLTNIFGKDLPIDEDTIFITCYDNDLEIVKELIKTFCKD